MLQLLHSITKLNTAKLRAVKIHHLNGHQANNGTKNTDRSLHAIMHAYTDYPHLQFSGPRLIYFLAKNTLLVLKF